jgi:uncharacterized protein
MTRYQTPGVYFEWLNTVSDVVMQRTDITGFIGICQRGPLQSPQKIESWPQFTSLFGGCIPQAYLAYAVQGFFANGGRTCWVVRTADPTAAHCAWANLRDERGVIRLSLRATSEGTWAHDMDVVVLRGGLNRFTLTLRLPDGTQELWRDLTLETAVAKLNDPVNGSRLVKAFRVNDARGKGQTLEAGRGTFKNGADGLASLLPMHLTGSGALEDVQWGLALLEDIPEISILAMPDALSKGVISPQTYTPPPRCDAPPFPEEDNPPPAGAAAAMPALAAGPTAPTGDNLPEKPEQKALREQAEAQTQADAEIQDEANREKQIAAGQRALADLPEPPEYPRAFGEDEIAELQWRMVLQCEQQKNRVAVLDLPRANMLPADAIAWARRFDSTYAALYYPWLRAPDPLEQPGALREIPPCGHVAGVYARVENVFGVHKPPANELLALAQDLSMAVNDINHGLLNEAQVNALRAYPGRGLRVVGERTLSSDPAWLYINVRRLLIMIERSIDAETQWMPFEPNNTKLWSDTQRVITSFLDRIWRLGMLDGAKAADAYVVRCDETINPPAETDQGRLHCLVGVQPPYPAEFVVVRIGKTESGSAVLEG